MAFCFIGAVARIIQLGSAASVSGIAVSAFQNRPSELCRAYANSRNKQKLLPEVSKVVRVLDCGLGYHRTEVIDSC